MKLFCKNVLLLKLTIAVLMFGYSQTNKCLDDMQKFILGGTAFGVTCAYLYNLYTNSASYHQSVIDNSYNTFHQSQNYLTQFKVLKQNFDVQNMNDSQKRIAANKINEYILNQLEPAISYYGVSAYLHNLNILINDLIYKKQNLRTTVSKLSRKDNCAQLLRNANDLYSTINDVMPQLSFLYLYINTHASYFTLYKFGKDVSQIYETQIRLMANEFDLYLSDLAKVEQIKKQILSKNRNVKYPYITYIQNLETNINNLNCYISQLAFRYPELLKGSKDLLSNLSWMLDAIVVDRDYLYEKEKYNLDKQREEQQRRENELREREIAAREREAAARERAAAAKEREAAAREQKNAIKMAQAVVNQNRPANAVHIHLNR